MHDVIIRSLKKAGIPEISKPFHHVATFLLNPSKGVENSQPLNTSVDLGIPNVVLTPSHGVSKRQQENTYQNERPKIPRLSAVEFSYRSQYNQLGEELGEVILPKGASTEGQLGQGLESRTSVSQVTLLKNSTNPHLQQSIQTALYQSKNPEQGVGSTKSPSSQPSPTSDASCVFGRSIEVDQRQTTSTIAQDSDSVLGGGSNTFTGLPITRLPWGPVYQGKATVARLDDLEKVLGHRLLEYMETSDVRCRENNRGDTGPLRVTSAVCLYFQAQSEKDFMLEISLGRLIGEAISQSLNSVEYLETLLGEYLFASMMASMQREEEKKRGMLASTSAAKVTFPSSNGSNDDFKLQLMVSNKRGREIWKIAF
ncbi:uncharacterized protein EKO05_0005360 [Ascochyta rabiei]|nr:uncharacterized protein EKO05_0005360 [Ascochyta rabiei]UPX14889.1 hypothetical protein EKO05_0005360 [Ascochyta rabiei]